MCTRSLSEGRCTCASHLREVLSACITVMVDLHFVWSRCEAKWTHILNGGEAEAGCEFHVHVNVLNPNAAGGNDVVVSVAAALTVYL